MTFEREDRVALSAAGLAAGYLLASWGVKKAGDPLVSYYNNDLRDQVNQSCGVDLNLDQWLDLLKTDDWMKFRTSLPLLPWLQRGIKLMVPVSIFSAGYTLMGGSANLLLSAFYDLDGPLGLLTFAVSGMAILYREVASFKEASAGFVNPGNIHPYSNICVAARKIASRGQPVVTGIERPPQQLPLFDKKGRPANARAMRTADARETGAVQMITPQMNPASMTAAVPMMPPSWLLWPSLPACFRIWI